jgi:hypothetical protein
LKKRKRRSCSLPVVVACDWEKATGWVREQPVRLVEPKEVEDARTKANGHNDAEVRWTYLIGLWILWRARKRADKIEATRGARAVWPFLPFAVAARNPDIFTDTKVAEAFPDGMIKWIATDATATETFNLPGWISGTVQNCSTQLYVPGNPAEAVNGAPFQYKPPVWATFCPDFAAAAAYHMFVMEDVKVCPKCQQLFEPSRPDQEFCSLPHREAYRLALWRRQNKAKEEAKAAKRQGGKQ